MRVAISKRVGYSLQKLVQLGETRSAHSSSREVVSRL